jgi:hypothetical protein
VHISQAVEFLCDWEAVVTFSRKNGEAFVTISAIVDDIEYRTTGNTIELAIPQMVKSIENATKMKYTRRLGGGKRRK